MEKITDLVEENKDQTQAADTRVRPAESRERRERSLSAES